MACVLVGVWGNNWDTCVDWSCGFMWYIDDQMTQPRDKVKKEKYIHGKDGIV
jgi:hypothetical protein